MQDLHPPHSKEEIGTLLLTTLSKEPADLKYNPVDVIEPTAVHIDSAMKDNLVCILEYQHGKHEVIWSEWKRTGRNSLPAWMALPSGKVDPNPRPLKPKPRPL